MLKLVHTIRKARREFLQELYHVTNGNELAMVNSFDIAKNIGLDKISLNTIYWYLLDEGLIEFRYNGGGISITHLGITTVEGAMQQNESIVDDYVSKIGLGESPSYRNDLPQEVNRLQSLSIKELRKEDESNYLEFKSSLRWDYKAEANGSKEFQLENIKAIPAFMNSHGGLLIMGIDKDNDKLIGLKKDFQTIDKNNNFDGWRLLLSDILYKRHKIELIFSDYLEINKKTTTNLHLQETF